MLPNQPEKRETSLATFTAASPRTRCEPNTSHAVHALTRPEAALRLQLINIAGLPTLFPPPQPSKRRVPSSRPLAS